MTSVDTRNQIGVGRLRLATPAPLHPKAVWLTRASELMHHMSAVALLGLRFFGTHEDGASTMRVTLRLGGAIAALSVAVALGVAWSSWADVPASGHHDATPARLFAGRQDPKPPLDASTVQRIFEAYYAAYC